MRRATSTLTLLACVAACLGAAAQPPKPHATLRRADWVKVGDRRVWVDMEGKGDLTVVFEAGGGNDSSVWSKIAPRIRKLGVRTFAYDRAGLGKSELDSSPYTIDNEVRTLRSAMTACDIKGPVIFVAHSYGGAIVLLAAAEDDRAAGMVLIDALVPFATPKSEVEAILAEYRPQYPELRQQAPELAKAMIPLMEAYPETVKRLDAVKLPEGLPVLDIVAEHSVINTPQTAAIWREAHATFTKHPHRGAVFASGSSHKVMEDRPNLVVQTITQMVQTLRKRRTAR